MNLRIQTWGKNLASELTGFANANRAADDAQSTVFDILRKGLNDLSDVCDVVEEKFTVARDEFNKQHPTREKS